MGLRPGNPVVGGNTLRRAAIQSPDYVPGVSGWSINQDGSAEFHGLILPPGTVFEGPDFAISGAGALFYSGTPAANNLSSSLIPGNASITDNYGNEALPGTTSYSYVAAELTYFAVQLCADETAPSGAIIDGLQFYTSTAGMNAWTFASSLGIDSTGSIYASAGGSGGLLYVLGKGLVIPGVTAQPSALLESVFYDWNLWPKYNSSADGANYSVGVQEYSASVAQTFGGAIIGSGGAINGLSAKLGPGKYLIQGQIDVSPTQAAGDGLLQFGGSATVSSMRVTVREELNGTPGANGNATTLTALAQQFTSATFTLPGRQWKFSGTITVSAPGTLIVQGGSSAAADTWATHIDGTYYTIRPHNP